MKAVILVGGQGTRLRPLTLDIPKPMLPMVNVPFFEHTLHNLASHGIKEIILSSGYLGKQFKDYFGDGSRFGVQLTNIIEDKPLGTCGAVKNVQDMLGKETTVVLNGDILSNINLTQLLDFHETKETKVTLTLYSVEDPTAYGLVSLNGDGRVFNFLEKPSFDEITTHWVNAGIYILEPEVLNYAPVGQNYSFERGLFPLLLKKNKKIFGFPFNGYWKDIGNPANYLKAHHDILEGRMNLKVQGEEIKPGVFVGDGCRISEKATIFGPTVIGKDCVVDDNAMIFSYTTIGNNCHIKASAKIYESIIFNNTEIGKDSVVKGSIAGKDVKLGDSVHVENLSVLGDNVSVGQKNILSKGIKLYPKTNIENEQIRF